MPVHDWSRVDPGIFHDFHNVWIAELRNALNEGILPSGFYALSEQHAGRYIADVLTLHTSPSDAGPPPRGTSGAVAVADKPPRVRHQVSLSTSARSRRKTLTIRHVSGHRIIALVEIVSSANKDRAEHVEALLDKVEDALRHGVHVLVVDLFAPGRYDRRGIHGAMWKRLGDKAANAPRAEPLTLASYVADIPIRAYVEHVALGAVLPEMPLFLDPSFYIDVPLERTYQTAWRGTPEYWRQVVERPSPRGNGRRRDK